MYDKLMPFLSESAIATDIFCFQEMLHNATNLQIKIWENGRPKLYTDIRDSLGVFQDSITKPYTSLGERMAIFSKNVNVRARGELILCKQRKGSLLDGSIFSIGSKLQWLEFDKNGKTFTIANVHGLWIKDNKGDSEERIEQSKRIVRFLDKAKGVKVLCGDFNLSPDTESIYILEQKLRNLIKEYKIKSTRNNLAETKAGKFADYMFISPEVEITSFRVIENKVSDHLPLILDFE